MTKPNSNTIFVADRDHRKRRQLTTTITSSNVHHLNEKSSLSSQSSSCTILDTTRHQTLQKNAKCQLLETEPEIGFSQVVDVNAERLHHSKSKYQSIDIYESKHFGKILTLDGALQLTEKDGDSYNEMMSHVPMMQHRDPRRVLIIGGGDGYVLNEVLKHASVEHVDHVELDDGVIDACKKYFSWGGAWDDPRVTLHITDGAAFVRNAPPSSYDVIIQDSSDPYEIDEITSRKIILPASVLYAVDHFSRIERALSRRGVFQMQAESYNVPSSANGIVDWSDDLRRVVGFGRVRYGSIQTVTYPTGHLGFLLCEVDPAMASTMEAVGERFRRFDEKGGGTTYYHPRLQMSAFDLPRWMELKLYGDSRTQTILRHSTSLSSETMPFRGGWYYVVPLCVLSVLLVVKWRHSWRRQSKHLKYGNKK